MRHRSLRHMGVSCYSTVFMKICLCCTLLYICIYGQIKVNIYVRGMSLSVLRILTFIHGSRVADLATATEDERKLCCLFFSVATNFPKIENYSIFEQVQKKFEIWKICVEDSGSGKTYPGSRIQGSKRPRIRIGNKFILATNVDRIIQLQRIGNKFILATNVDRIIQLQTYGLRSLGWN